MRRRTKSYGVCRLFQLDEHGVKIPGTEVRARNSRMYTWGFLAAKCLGQHDLSYALNCAYVEYQNVSNPTDPVSIPSFNLEDDRTYYEGLAASPNRDYLRIPLRLTPEISIEPGYELFFAPGQGNKIWISGQTAGSVGMTGKPFSAGSNSKVCGVAILAAPVLADRTQDVLFARAYYAVDKQVVKSASGQLAFEYGSFFGVDA